MKQKEENIKYIIDKIKDDIRITQRRVVSNANLELIMLYFRIGKFIYDNNSYGKNFINILALELKVAFPKMRGFSSRNLSRMYLFYKEYKDIVNLPTVLANLPWSYNYSLIEKVKDFEKRLWYAEKCLENGWSHSILIYQIESDLYQRQLINPKLTNFKSLLPDSQQNFALSIIKDPYVFDLIDLKEKVSERELEESLLSQIKVLLLELGNGFSFVGSQYKISTKDSDYYIDLLFYHITLKCYVVVELKNDKFKPDYIGQLNFYITAINNTIKTSDDNPTLGLLLCKEKDKLSVEWALDGVINPIGVSSYVVGNNDDLIKLLPTEDDFNKYIEFIE